MLEADAAFSACGQYRWWLRRCWDSQAPVLLFIGLNPSRADGVRDDPTLRRLVGFARCWGYGALEVVNLFARISPAPAALKRVGDPVGESNDAWLQRAQEGAICSTRPGACPVAPAIWLGWGNQGAWRGRDQQVLALLQTADTMRQCRPVWCLGLTAAGQPRHPLYVAAATARQRLVLAQTAGAGAFCGAPLQLQG